MLGEKAIGIGEALDKTSWAWFEGTVTAITGTEALVQLTSVSYYRPWYWPFVKRTWKRIKWWHRDQVFLYSEIKQ